MIVQMQLCIFCSWSYILASDITLVTLLVSAGSLVSSTTGGADTGIPHGTQMPSTNLFPSHLPDRSTGNFVTIIATIVSVVVILTIIVVVCIVLIAVLTCVKGRHHKQIELRDTVCYTTSSTKDKNVIRNLFV